MDTCNPCTCTELHPSTHSSTVWSHNQTVPAGVATPSTPVGSVVRHGPRHALHVAAPISPRFPFSGPFLWLKLWTEGRTRALSLLGLDAPITVEVALVVVDVRHSVLASSDARLMDVMGIGAEDSGRGLALDGVPTTISTSISLI